MWSCEYASEYKGNLKKHIAWVHERIKPFKCKFCNYETGKKIELKRHKQSLHKETQSSAAGRPENMGMPELIQSLLREQVLLPYLENSGVH